MGNKWWILVNKRTFKSTEITNSIDDMDFETPYYHTKTSIFKKIKNFFSLLFDMYSNLIVSLVMLAGTSIFCNKAIIFENLGKFHEHILGWYYYILFKIPFIIVTYPIHYIKENTLTNFHNIDMVLSILSVFFLLTIFLYVYNLIMDGVLYIYHFVTGRTPFFNQFYFFYTAFFCFFPLLISVIISWLTS